MSRRARQTGARLLCATLAGCLCLALLASCGTAGTPEDVPEPSAEAPVTDAAGDAPEDAAVTDGDAKLDMVTEYAVYLVGEEDGCAEYQIFVCGYDTRRLLAVADETVFLKSAGYAESVLAGMDFDEVWPHASELDFVSTAIADRGDYLLAGIWFEDLDDPKNLQALADAGFFGLSGKVGDAPLDADELMRLTVEQGGRLLAADDEAFSLLELEPLSN